MSKFVVTANYLDRSDKVNRWLVRREDEPISACQKVSSLVATGVKFRDNNADDPEYAYACTVIALCDSVTFTSDSPKLSLPVEFNHMFIAYGRRLSGVSELSLGADGSISADGIVIDESDTYIYK